MKNKKHKVCKKVIPHRDIMEIIKRISELVGCGIQHNGSPCNTCFHDWADSRGLPGDIGHLFWLALLGIRGDYKEEDVLEAVKLIIKKKKK
jgi:hypothetical protein